MTAFHGSFAINKTGKKIAPKAARRRCAATVSRPDATSTAPSTEHTPIDTPAASTTPTNEIITDEVQTVLPTPPLTQGSPRVQLAHDVAAEQCLPCAPLSVLSNESDIGATSPGRGIVDGSTSTPAAIPFLTTAGGSCRVDADINLPSRSNVMQGVMSAGDSGSSIVPPVNDACESNMTAGRNTSKATRRRGDAQLSNKHIVVDGMKPHSGLPKPSISELAPPGTADDVFDSSLEVLSRQNNDQRGPGAEDVTHGGTVGSVSPRSSDMVLGTPSTEESNQPENIPEMPGHPANEAAQVMVSSGNGTSETRQTSPRQRPVNSRKPCEVPDDHSEGQRLMCAIGMPKAGAGRGTIKRHPKNIRHHLIFDDEDRENPEKTRINAKSMPMSVLTKDISMVGTKSQREEALARINWSEEKRRRIDERERIALGEGVAPTRAEREAALVRLQEASNALSTATQAPQMRLVNGVMTLDHTSTQVDRNARAREDAEELQEVEEDELTTRVHQMSWIKANRKDPRERMEWGPMRADRWSREQTDMFYDSLRMFGTDFFIISKMFPGKSRANIKRKFVKEERLDPGRIKRMLVGESVPMDFEVYKRKTGKDDDFFRDPDQLRQELERETEHQRQEVGEAQARYAEQQRQRKLAKQGRAGMDGDEGEGAKKANKRKRDEGKRDKKSKAPVGGEELEVVEFDGDELEHRR